MKGDGLTSCRDCGHDYHKCTCCPVHEAEIRAADALAKVIRKYGNDPQTIVPIEEALAAYEKVRGG